VRPVELPSAVYGKTANGEEPVNHVALINTRMADPKSGSLGIIISTHSLWADAFSAKEDWMRKTYQIGGTRIAALVSPLESGDSVKATDLAESQ
jgi:hypothetical protein